MAKLFCAIVLLMSSIFANADDTVRLKHRIERLAQSVADKVHASSVSEVELQTIAGNLSRSLMILDGDAPSGPGRPPGPGRPGYGLVQILKAACHIDDDPDFDFNQTVIEIFATTIEGLEQKCQQKAFLAHGERGSSGLKDVEGFLSYTTNSVLSAICHIDDDPRFDYDQKVVGTIFGSTLESLESTCQQHAFQSYQNRGSSGLKDLTVAVDMRGFHSLKAVCHVDDDPNFDFDQRIMGEIFASTVEQLNQKCAQKASDLYGARGSSGLKQISGVQF